MHGKNSSQFSVLSSQFSVVRGWLRVRDWLQCGSFSFSPPLRGLEVVCVPEGWLRNQKVPFLV
jgi:hypothetical protein